MKSVKILYLFLIIFASASVITAQQGHRIEVQLKGFENKDAILGYYSNKKMYVTDTVQFNDKGVAVFAGDEPYPGGLYLVYLPNGKYFDLLLDSDQTFSIKTDTTDLIGKMEIKGATDPLLFNQYQRFISDRQKKASTLQTQIKETSDETQKAELQKQLKTIDQEVKDYWRESSTSHPESFYAVFLKSMQEPEIPTFDDVPQTAVNRDSIIQMRRYLFIRDHFFDNINFTDQRLLRTPFYPQKLDTYFDRFLIQSPDTVTEAAINIIEKCRPNKEMFRFTTQYLFNKINDNKIMGMDAAVVALAHKYYLSGDAEWATDEFLEKLEKYVRDVSPTLIGKTAHDLRMESLDGQIYRLHEINAPVTIVAFYEPTCGHCKKEIPKLYKEVFEPYRSKGVQVFAVYSLNDRKEWQDFVDEHELYNWINVYDPHYETNFRSYYDIRSTPMIYILDKNKKIVGKRLDVEQMPGFLDHLLKQQ